MKLRKKGDETKVEMQMTAMIDVVFQLLIFFMLSFKIVAMEGDFNVKMPLAAPRAGLPDDKQIPPVKIRLEANAEYGLGRLSLNGQVYEDPEKLRNYIIGFIGPERGPGSLQDTAEVELDCDYDLKYAEVVAIVTAVSGYVADDKTVVKLIEKIKFAPPRKGGGG